MSTHNTKGNYETENDVERIFVNGSMRNGLVKSLSEFEILGPEIRAWLARLGNFAEPFGRVTFWRNSD